MVSPISNPCLPLWPRTSTPPVGCADTSDFHEHLAKDRARTAALYDELPAWIVTGVMNQWLRRGAVDSVDFRLPQEPAQRRESPFARQIAGAPSLAEVLPVPTPDVRRRLEIVYRLKTPLLPGTTLDVSI